MRNNAGLLAGLMVILAFFGVSNLSNRGPEAPPSAESGKPSSPSGKTESSSEEKAALDLLPCKEIANRLRRFLVTDPGRIESWWLPDACYETPVTQNRAAELQLKTPRTWPDVQFAIATAPNPVSTHLPLMFDRIVETIQQAAQDDGYTYDGSWFPWEAASHDHSSLADQLAAQEYRKIQQAQPGVMVFRDGRLDKADCPPYHHGLVIFLVAEQPTGGISDDEFENALQWINQFGNSTREQSLRILGPTFSGSLPSLRRALEHNLTAGTLKRKPVIKVSSGSVSSHLGYDWFRNWLDGHNGSFQTALENDDLVVDRFCKYLTKQGYSLDRVAMLSEDETAFGGATADKECYDPSSGGAFYLYYPRDIATLRSAYEQQSIFSSAKGAPDGNAPSTTLRGDLSEPAGSEHDTVRRYGGALTPLAQESVLLQITNLLKEKQAEFIILRSTNPLDQIFLSEFLHRSYPEGRVVIENADLLFTRGSEGKSLSGAMLLSTYPLLTRQQDWTSTLLNQQNGSYRTFSEDLSEGVYIAARDMFRIPGPPRPNEVPIHDYAPPAWAVDQHTTDDNWRPATWITVLGHRQFWPVAVLNSYTLGDRSKRGTLLPGYARGDGFPVDAGDPLPLRLPIMMWMLLIACLGWSGFHLYFCSRGSLTGSPRARAFFAPIPRWQHPVLIALGSLLIAMLAVVVAAFSGFFSYFVPSDSFLPVKAGGFLALWILLILVASSLACSKNYSLPVQAVGAWVVTPLLRWPRLTKPSQWFTLRRPRLAKSWQRFARLWPDRAKFWRDFARRWQIAAGVSAVVFLLLFVGVNILLVRGLTPANRFPAYWRSVNLLSGVSPLLPQLLLIAGMYL